jgi:hypothetical protein
MILEATILSIPKKDCENYLLEDYPLKACIDWQNSKITLAGRKVW